MSLPNTIFVTGCAGFIGSQLIYRLLSEGYSVVGLDNLNDYFNEIANICEKVGADHRPGHGVG